MKLIQKFQWVAVGLSLFFSLSVLLNLPPVQSAATSDCFATMTKADELYQAGKKKEAKELYRQCKLDFANSDETATEIPDPVYEIEELGGGRRLWQQAQEGMEQDSDAFKSKIFFNLIGLTRSYPQFVPAQLTLVDFCLRESEFCAQYAQEGQAKTASQILERLTELYPDNPDLLRKKIEVFAAEEKLLEASIAARQFSLVYNDYPEATEFAQLADNYLKKFESKVKQQLIGQTVVGTVIGVLAGGLNQNPYQVISGFQMAFLMIQGESAFGEQMAAAFAGKYEKEGKLVEDGEVLNYIKGIAARITSYMGRDFDYKYYVVKNSKINAFALSGGKVFINTGAILQTNSEAELAGLLGHEIAHAVLSHGFLKTAQANLLGNLSQIVPFLDRVSPVVSAQYSQEAERQADILGTRSLALSGYAADGLRNLTVTFKKLHGDAPTNYLSTHPAPVERVSYLEKMIHNNGYDRYAYEGVKKHREIQERLKNSS